MLTESLVASVLGSAKTQTSSTLKDVGICIQELQPTSALRATFKKSSTPPNGLAVTPTHVFAAQTDKAVIHVYSRLRGNQEATIPFPERIRSVAVAGGQNGEILVLGTEGGRLILWETCTGRQVSTTPSHLQPVTSLVVDPTSQFIISGSSDASVHVWSIPQLLSFSRAAAAARDQKAPNSPIRSFSNHRTAITALAVGHACSRSNIAISAARDNTAVVWEYNTGNVLRTYLLPFTAISIAVDPADRAFYVGYEAGNVQRVDFYETPSAQHPLYDVRLQNTPSQINSQDQWLVPSTDKGAATTLALSYDGMTLYSGHPNGSVLSWDVTRGKYSSTVADYLSPVTNLHTLLPVGFPSSASQNQNYTIPNIIKPQYSKGMSDASQGNGAVPSNYTLSVQLTPNPQNSSTLFSEALTHASFPASLIEEGLAELAAFGQGQTVNGTSTTQISSTNKYTANTIDSTQIATLEEEIASLKRQLSVSEDARQAQTEEVIKLRTDLRGLQDYTSQFQQDRARLNSDKAASRANNEDRDFQRRQEWFEAEKGGIKGDATLRNARTRDEDVSDSD
ncbi:putative ribosomal assembly complex component Ipi3 [Talaromyces proteolyticus]|uniref:Pre-rRNA-processing protein IPI3 n=1 Tax=Talaromyces proteolyticus TaxID=1131652 RepID=A0AAD4Q582_9EURO|nr:putative ribosomal assembly complex component Ipi3 [Talaromyces proteolyticus]KAH8703760.1 putative ribosomal assembly complex component Ipi3 [Talaromyces proteolyticus]